MSLHKENWQMDHCITSYGFFLLRYLDSQSWCFRIGLCETSPECQHRHPPAAQCKYWETPGRNTVLLGAPCPIFCTRAAPSWRAVVCVGQEQLHIKPATGPRETLLNHVWIQAEIQSYGYH